MRALPDGWVHRRPAGPSWGPLDDKSPAPKGPPPHTTGWHVLAVLLRNEFRARYRSQALGILWSLPNPLVQTTILSVIFSHVSAFKSAIPNYPVYLLIGVVVWQFFATAINTATQSFIAQADIVKRTVIYRDVAFLVSTAVTLLYWLVPIIYPVSFVDDAAIPHIYKTIYHLNPVASVIIALRGCLMDGTLPSAITWAGMLGPTALMLLVGWAVFRHYERMVLDYV